MKIGAIIQARFASSRLPGKVLMHLPLLNGKPILKYITDGVKKSNIVSYVGIATSNQIENNEIETFALKEQVDCYRGSEDDVLNRFITIAQKENLDSIIRLTGDNPLIDVQKLDEAIDYHINSENEYTKTKGLPLGMNFEIINATTLLNLKSENLSSADKEHVTKFINDNEKFKKSVYTFNTNNIADLRCTIDYPSDYAMMTILLPLITARENVCDQIEQIQKKYPWVFVINSDNHQIKYYNTLEEELKIVLPLLKRMEMLNTISYLKS